MLNGRSIGKPKEGVKMKQVLRLHNKIQERREELGKDKRWLADMVGSSVVTITAIEDEDHTPTIYLALLLSCALNMDVKDMFWLEIEVEE